MATAIATSQETALIPKLEAQHRSESLWARGLRSLRRDRLSVVAIVTLGLLTLACIIGPPILERSLNIDSNRTNVVNRFKTPGTGNAILGTDQLGRDQLVRLLYGGRVSLAVAYGASLMSITLGVILGAVAGYYGGIIDDVINWFISTLSSIPSIFLLILVSVVFSPTPEILIILLGLFGWIETCRLVRGEVFSLKEREFVIAARASGVPTRRLLTHHLLPNLISIVLVTLTINAGSLILIEAGLSYLGLGIRPPTPSWGNMLTNARQYFSTGTHLVIWPGVMIVITVLCFYIIGDGLRDAFDPRTQQH